MHTIHDVLPTDRYGSALGGEARRRRIRLLIAVAAVLFLASAAALAVDVPLGRWCLDTFGEGAGANARSAGRWWRSPAALVCRLAEPFGHGLGAALIVLVIFQLDPARRWAIPRVLTATFGAGLVVNVIKVMMARTRPHSFDFEGTVWDTFGTWLPLLGEGSRGQSLPSGHTATAVGLAMALVWLYPRGRWLFPALAALVACQRVQGGAHWLSDVLLAAVVGCLVSLFCLDLGPIARAFDRWESGWRRQAEERGERREERPA